MSTCLQTVHFPVEVKFVEDDFLNPTFTMEGCRRSKEGCIWHFRLTVNLDVNRICFCDLYCPYQPPEKTSKAWLELFPRDENSSEYYKMTHDGEWTRVTRTGEIAIKIDALPLMSKLDFVEMHCLSESLPPTISSVVSRKRSLREHLYDFSIQVGDQTFDSNRAYLADASEYFAEYFSSNSRLSSSSSLEVTNADPEVFRILIDFINRNEVPEETDWLGLLVLADRFQVTVLSKHCQAKLIFDLKNYELRCVPPLWTVATMLNLVSLKKEALKVITKKWKEDDAPIDEETLEVFRQTPDLMLEYIAFLQKATNLRR